jgi:hypothetical protein
VSAPASAHVVDGTYRSDVTAENCGQYDACGSGQSSGGSSDSSSSGSGGYSIPESIVECESGGDYSAVNPSSGAGGAYQFLPSTWASLGGEGAPQDASPAEQDRLAAKLYAQSGSSPWECAG